MLKPFQTELASQAAAFQSENGERRSRFHMFTAHGARHYQFGQLDTALLIGVQTVPDSRYSE